MLIKQKAALTSKRLGKEKEIAHLICVCVYFIHYSTHSISI